MDWFLCDNGLCFERVLKENGNCFCINSRIKNKSIKLSSFDFFRKIFSYHLMITFYSAVATVFLLEGGSALYCIFAFFPGLEILWKGKVSA